MDRGYLVIILSIIGIISLYYLSLLSQPIEIGFQDISQYENHQVILKGVVMTHRTTSFGGQIIEIRDDTDESELEVIVFIEEEGTLVEYGDLIQVTGMVQKYEDEWEVVVNSGNDVTILQKWQNITIPLWQLAQNPDRYIGLNINVSGNIDRIYEGYFYLIDEEQEHSLAVYYNSAEFQNLTGGDNVKVAGFFNYDYERLRYLVQVTESIHGIIHVD